MKRFPFRPFVLHFVAAAMAGGVPLSGQRFEEPTLVFMGGIAFAAASYPLKETLAQFKAALARE